ncbi:MAG: sigma-70 family RNA polymerase sigma factor [Clostridia bacterium]|nr:sigma-70 family RNA polymerase sigma factor [Clostridia bacterium]
MKQTLDELVPAVQASLYRAAFSICRNRQDAENVVQDTFLIYDRSAKQFDSPAHIHAWLLRVAVNRAKDVCRSFWRRNRVSLDETIAQIPFETPQDSDVFQAVMRLPENQRIVIYLFYYEDRPIHEIARILRTRENTVKSRLHRARLNLKKLLQEGWNDDEP